MQLFLVSLAAGFVAGLLAYSIRLTAYFMFQVEVQR